MKGLLAIFGRGPTEVLDLAIARAARLRGELEQARFVCEQYANRIQAINPHDDWWTFAHLKQRHVDACEQCAELSALYGRAMVQLSALERAA
jgi:hypothetical protein